MKNNSVIAFTIGGVAIIAIIMVAVKKPTLENSGSAPVASRPSPVVHVVSQATGSANLNIVSLDGQAQSNCTFDFMQLADDPKPTHSASCRAVDGCYHFDGLAVGQLSVVVACDQLLGQVSMSTL